METSMTTAPATKSITSAEGRDLVLTRHINAPRERVYRAWTDPEWIVKWFTPAPWKTASAKMDVRAGGSSLVVMQSPEGRDVPNPGVFLEVVPNQKLVITNAYTSAWEPAEMPSGPGFFMTFVLTFEEENGGTRYTARVRHWSLEDLKAHEAMGFHQGWAIATEQLATLVE
jgi:uncharacterized protein YndB with AHSA1/START domain